MVSTIQTLPKEVVHLIAAGEVIDSFAAVVRELVENSLDAGAKRIVVYLYPEEWRIRVVDNGCGMSYEDLQNAASAHSTSKIHSGADLWNIHSLGFRGEALHCLTTLADVEIISRRDDLGLIPFATETAIGDTCGWQVTYGSGGRVSRVEATAIAPGTVVTVSNLFGNCVERRQGLPSIAQQLKAVQATIHQIALCHPQVAWQVWQGSRIWFNISPAKTMGKLLPQILHQIRQGDLHEIEVQLSQHQNIQQIVEHSSQYSSKQYRDASYRVCVSSTNVMQENAVQQNTTSSLYLATGLPDRCHRHRPDWVRCAINGRMIKSPELEQTVLGAFHRTLPRDRYPVCLIHLSISPEQVNWNRNPAKTEIYLNQLDYWQGQITQAIEQALRINSDTVNEVVQTSRVSKLIKVAEQNNNYYTNSLLQSEVIGSKTESLEDINQLIDTTSSLCDQETSSQQELSNPHNLKAVAQVNNTYIVVEHPGGLWLVEQHIAHERVLYELICDNWQLVPIEPAIILYQLSLLQVSQLQNIGLDIEPFGEHLWAVRSVPAMLKERQDCSEAILELSMGGDLKAAQVAVACRSAIRNGTPLSISEMQILIERWQRTRNPRTCPHGRPICLSLLESSLSRYFKRHWVIGKSHGI